MKDGKCFLHFPWIFPAERLREFVNRVILDPQAEVAHDIWMAQRLMELDFPIHNLLGLTAATPNGIGEGYSQNSFDTPERIANAVHQVKNGAYALHGVKTREALAQILAAAGKQHLRPTVYTYYEDIKFAEQDRLIKLWRESWARNGYEPVVLSRSDAEAHPFYKEFSERIQALHFQITGKDVVSYGMACWLRWLAYASRGVGRFYVCDYDVINHHFEPTEPKDGLWFLDGNCPCIASGSASEFEELCRKFCSFAEDRLEDFSKIYKVSGFVWFHDQEFLSAACELGLNIGEMSRERSEFIGIPGEGEFWKRKVVHYGHSIIARHCEAAGKAYTDTARCDLIEESLSR